MMMIMMYYTQCLVWPYMFLLLFSIGLLGRFGPTMMMMMYIYNSSL